MATYSFLDIHGSIVGPGGSFSIASGSGVAEGGITIAQVGDKNTLTSGADGSFMHSLSAARKGTITIRLLKTSPTNQKLNQMYCLQTMSSATHGCNVIVLQDKASGDVITCFGAAFKKHPDVVYGKDGGTMDWVFDVGSITTNLGAGVAGYASAIAAAVQAVL